MTQYPIAKDSYGDPANPNYHPEGWGMEVVAELEMSNRDYEFDVIVVWKRKADGAMFYAQDSGCSCPIPFEDFKTWADLNSFNLEEVRDIVMARKPETDASWVGINIADRDRFLRTIAEAAQ